MPPYIASIVDSVFIAMSSLSTDSSLAGAAWALNTMQVASETRKRRMVVKVVVTGVKGGPAAARRALTAGQMMPVFGRFGACANLVDHLGDSCHGQNRARSGRSPTETRR